MYLWCNSVHFETTNLTIRLLRCLLHQLKLYSWELRSQIIKKQSGAVEACWAHNPEVRRSKLRSATKNYFVILDLPENRYAIIFITSSLCLVHWFMRFWIDLCLLFTHILFIRRAIFITELSCDINHKKTKYIEALIPKKMSTL